MKNSRSLISLTALFVAGFLAGVVFSAWKLDSVVPQTPDKKPPPKQTSKRAEIEKRIAGVKKMLADDPGNLTALVQLGNDYFDIGNFEDAITAYSDALKIDPKNADVITDMGIAYRRLRKPQEAVDSFRRALEANPNHTTALFNLGIVLRDDIKDYDGALKAWETFMEKAKDSPFSVMVRPWVQQLREKVKTEPTADGTKKE
ncbi:MAG: tetratricopeptide repeat protein [Desulfomonilaceae bacterium]|nr:tetratricopeptide repeat protein [Desulfomonilaceae bacterium]